MRLDHFISAMLSSALLVVFVEGCRPSSQDIASATPAAIHGEPIQPVKAMNPAPVATVSPVETKPIATNPDYATVGFDTLASYNFEVDDLPLTNQTAGAADKANDQIPSLVKSLDDKKVSIKGFMLPLKVADGTVTEFLIMKDQSMCCYGSTPKITEWVNVKTGSRGVKPIMDEPVSIEGTLHVGATRENGYLIGIYQMDGDKLVTKEN